MTATVSTLFDTGALVEAIKPGGPHFWRAARIVALADSHYLVCFSGDQTRYQIEPKCVRLRNRNKTSSSSTIPSTTKVDMSTKGLNPSSAAIAISSKPPQTAVNSSRFECGAVVEAIKPGGPHFWRAARVIECLEDRYQVSFSGDKKLYNVGFKFVRKRPIKEKPKQAEEPSAVVDLTLWSSDSSPEPDDNVDSKQLGHHTLLDPYRISDPYATNATAPSTITSNTVSQPSCDPYAYSQFPIREQFLNQTPLNHQLFTNRQLPLWQRRHNYKSRKRGNGRPKTPHSNSTPTTYTPSFSWLKKGIRGYHNLITSELWPPSDTDEGNRWGDKQVTSSSEEAVTREPTAVEKIAREQEKLGLDAALARVSIPRKPLPRNARRSQPRMSLGNFSSGKESVSKVDQNQENSVSSPLAIKSVQDLPIAPPPLPSSSKAVLCRPRSVRKPNLEDTVSSSDEDEDIRRGPRLSQRQRELLRKRRAEQVNDETVPSKKQQAIGSKFPRRKQIGSGIPSTKRGVSSAARKTKVSKQVSQIINARGNGRRKSQAKRNAGLSTIAVLTSLDRGIDYEYAQHRKEVAKSVAELEELSNAMSNMQMNDTNEEKTACDCTQWDEQRATTADETLKCHLCKRNTHLMCSALKRRRILTAMDCAAKHFRAPHSTSPRLQSPFMCVSCADLIVMDNKQLERAETNGEKSGNSIQTKWTIVIPITPLFHACEMSKWTRIVALRENERRITNRMTNGAKRKAGDTNQNLQLTEESKNKMMRNVEDLRSGILRCSFFSNGAVSRLTVYG